VPVIVARNAFIRRIAIGVAGVAAGAGLPGAATARFSTNRSTVAVGRRYLAMHPNEADASLLAQSLERPARIAVRARDDFASGDIVVIDGWLVGRSEARLCALASLAVRDAD
jgi:hypothetical protein